MADVIKKSDLDGWYSKLNAILSKHGQSTVTKPTIDKVVKASHFTPLTAKLEQMKKDTYYQYATYKDWGDIAPGKVVRKSTFDALNDTVNGIEATIVCRNTANNANQYKSNVVKSNGLKSNQLNQYDYHSNGTNDYLSYGNGTCSKGTKSNGPNWYDAGSPGEGYTTTSNGNSSSGTPCHNWEHHTNTTYPNGTQSYGSESNGTDSYQTRSNGVCSKTLKSNTPKSYLYNQDEYNSNMKKTNGTETDVGNTNTTHSNG